MNIQASLMHLKWTECLRIVARNVMEGFLLGVFAYKKHAEIPYQTPLSKTVFLRISSGLRRDINPQLTLTEPQGKLKKLFVAIQ